jgi:hypothetical protein
MDKLKNTEFLGNLFADGRMMLKWVLKITIQQYEDQDIQNDLFAGCFMMVWEDNMKMNLREVVWGHELV